MKKIFYALATILVFILLVVSWLLSFHTLFEANIMSIFNFLFFMLPASMIITILLFYIFHQDKKLFIRGEIPSSKSVMSVSMTLLSIAIILFSYPFFPGSNKIVSNHKAIFDTISIENVLKTDLIDKETQYNTSLYEKKRIGKITYISSEYQMNMDKIWLRFYDSQEKIVAFESSFRYIKNVPDLFYNVERSVFNSLANTWRHEYDTNTKSTVSGADSQTKYTIYSYNLDLANHNSSEMQVVIILAENGDDFLLYRLAVCDDYDNLEIKKEYILELVESFFENKD